MTINIFDVVQSKIIDYFKEDLIELRYLMISNLIVQEDR